MNEYFEANKRSLILLASMLFILALVLYLMLLRPLLADYKAEQQKLVSLTNDIELLEAEIDALQDAPEEIDVAQLMLENKIPKERELDEYILTLQQLELYTNSKIEAVHFAYDSNLPIQEDVSVTTLDDEVEAELSPEETDDEDEAVDESTESEEEAVEPTADPAILNEKPEELHVMTVRVVATSPDFDEFVELLKRIEQNERINIVTSLRFTTPTEEDIYFSDNPIDDIPFEAELTTFYFAD